MRRKILIGLTAALAVSATAFAGFAFVQVNRFQIVPLEGILEAGAAELKLKDGTVLAIGAKHADDFRKVYDSYRSGKKS